MWGPPLIAIVKPTKSRVTQTAVLWLNFRKHPEEAKNNWVEQTRAKVEQVALNKAGKRK